MTKSKQTSSYRSPRSVADVTRENVHAMRELEALAKTRRSLADRLAERVAGFTGSFAFVVAHMAIFAGWIIWNTWPGLQHFDPYPFIFLTLCVSLEAIFLSSFILISQNYEMRVTERRNELDLQIDLLAEQENTKMLRLLEGIAGHLGVRADGDPEVRVLEQTTRPETLARQIDEEFRKAPGEPGVPGGKRNPG